MRSTDIRIGQDYSRRCGPMDDPARIRIIGATTDARGLTLFVCVCVRPDGSHWGPDPAERTVTPRQVAAPWIGCSVIPNRRS